MSAVLVHCILLVCVCTCVCVLAWWALAYSAAKKTRWRRALQLDTTSVLIRLQVRLSSHVDFMPSSLSSLSSSLTALVSASADFTASQSVRLSSHVDFMPVSLNSHVLVRRGLKECSVLFCVPAGAQSADKIDLSVVRLCFQAFLPDANRRFTRVIPPIVSQPVVDKSQYHTPVSLFALRCRLPLISCQDWCMMLL